ncbi:hypothetical protein [Aquimarina sp. MMG016]|uniref:hypothetical protein n=1 Tax=Aquimarina sp. MMG016 TaxID=2822690 RepID=UPI001B3A2266|nr:hypothetical protein [Aquimarina sp. MMG016]MBQ4819364.1 hypothetical protein [Aquimarina sp. MMG016]
MKSLKYFLVFFILSFCEILLAQDMVITISEEDQDGKYLNRDGTIKPGFINAKIADINSTLDINLNKNTLITKIGGSFQARLPNDLSSKLSKLTKVMESRNESLKNLERIVNLYDYNNFRTDSNAYNNYITQLQQAVAKLEEIAEIDPRIEERALEFDDLYGSVYQAAEAVFNDVYIEFKNFTNREGVNIQFGSWLVAKGRKIPIHLQGFDSIAPQSPFEVERWQFSPTDEQIEELEKLTQYANENRGVEDEILKNIVRNQIQQLRDFTDTKILELQRKVEEALERVRTELGETISPKLKTLFDEIDRTIVLIEDFVREITIRKKYYQNIISGSPYTIDELIFRLQRDVKFVKDDKGKEVLNQIVNIANLINSSDEDITKDLKVVFNDLKEEFEIGISVFSNSVTDNIRIFLYGEDLDFAALKFSEEVFSLSLDDLPESTRLDLIDTGVRKDGDQLAFKLEVRSKKGIIYTENRKLYMFRVLTHIEGTVGVIFADPLARTEIKTQFQMAPYYNMIIKGLFDQKLRRRSVPYNRIFDWGIGLHLSAPDFDGDDVPELGTGIVISMLHDYIQSGAAINVFNGDPYWFFGLRLPVPSFNIGSLPSTSN